MSSLADLSFWTMRRRPPMLAALIAKVPAMAKAPSVAMAPAQAPVLQHTDPRAAAIDQAADMVISGRFRTDLADLVAYRSESQNPAQAVGLMRYLTEAVMPRLESLGFTCLMHANPVPGGGPLLTAERIEGADLPTVLGYGHGDVSRGQDEDWRPGLAPFALKEQDGRYWGRGVADNKGQHLINLLAMESVIATRGRLGFNAKLLFEMSEETGSRGLHAFCAANRDLLAADVLIASDGPRLQADTPTLFMGSRGAVNFDLVVELRDGAHHSGNWGGLLADPAVLLAQAVASITDARGQIRIPEWRPTSLTAAVRATLAGLPLEGEGPAIDADWGEEGLTAAERAFGWNSFTVLSMKSGVPEAPVNAIAGQARASCQLRFVVGTDTDGLIPALRRHLDAHGLQAVRIDHDAANIHPATRLDPDHPWVRRVAGSVARTTGRAPHLLPNLAGSLPNDCFATILGLPTVWVPHSWRGCSQHAPNEHLPVALAEDGLRVMAGLYWDIGSGNLPA